MVNALIFGEDSNFTNDLKEDLKISGIYHIFSVSGSNFTLLFLCIQFLTRKLPVRISKLVSIIFLLVYLIAVGFDNIPALRSFIFISILVVLNIFGRKVSVFYLFLLAICLLIINNPFIIYSLSFQLTVFINGGLIIFGSGTMGVIENFIRNKVISATISMTFISFLFSSIVLYPTFSQISLVTFLSNLAIIYLLSPILIGGIFMILNPFGLLNNILTITIDSFCYCLNFFIEIFGSINFLVISKPGYFLIVLCIGFGLLTLFDYKIFYEKYLFEFR